MSPNQYGIDEKYLLLLYIEKSSYKHGTPRIAFQGYGPARRGRVANKDFFLLIRTATVKHTHNALNA